MKTKQMNILKGIKIQLTKLENSVANGVVTRLDESEIRAFEAKLCNFYDIDDISLVCQTELGQRFMRIRLTLVEQANQRLRLIA